MGIQRTLVQRQQSVLAQEGRYGAALETLSEKIKGIWAIQRDFLEHEKDTLTDVIRARAEALDRSGQEFAAAVAEGDPDKTIEAANRFQEATRGLALSVDVVALQEAYPQLFSPPIVQDVYKRQTRENADGFPELIRFLADLGVRYIGCNSLIKTGGGRNHKDAMDEAELEAILKKAVDVADELKLELSWFTPCLLYTSRCV